MPVDDMPVHERTKIDHSHRYGCHNRPPFAPGYPAPERELPIQHNGFVYAAVWIENNFSKHCNHGKNGMALTDPSCTGCEHRENEKE